MAEASVNKIGAIFDTGWKIISALVVIIGGISSIVVAWIHIETNTNDIKEQKKDFQIEMATQKSTFETEMEQQERRNESRFNRSTEWNQDRKKNQDEIEERLRKVEQDDAYNKGYHDALKEKKQSQ